MEAGERGGTKRLLALNHFANPIDAPGGTRLVELTERLDGWDSTIVAASRNLFTRAIQVSDHASYKAVWTTPYHDNGLQRLINWISYAGAAFVLGLVLPRPDLVYASSPHLLTGVAGWAIAVVRRTPFVLEIRDLWPQILADTGRLSAESKTYRRIKRVELFLYRRADAIVVLTQGVADAVADEGVPRERIALVPNGADPEDFVVTTDRATLRRRFGFTGLTVVYAGAHGPANGLDFVLDAAAELADELPEVQFVLVGDGLTKPALVARAQREHLHNVTFLDPIPKSEIPELLAASDVGLHVLADLPLFLYGVSPNKLFDYMAAGRPVLTNTAGEVGELVKQNDAGVVVGPTALASGVRQLAAAGTTTREQWGRNGQAFMAANRSRSLMATRLQAVLDRVVRSG